MKRAIILEDEVLIAMDLESELQDAGFDVVAVAHSIRHGEALVDRAASFDVALLDVNMGGDLSFDIARTCVAAGKRIVFLSGHTTDILPEDLKDQPILRKPVQMQHLLKHLMA